MSITKYVVRLLVRINPSEQRKSEPTVNVNAADENSKEEI